MRQFPRFKAQETIEDGGVAIEERDVRQHLVRKSRSSDHVLMQLFLSSTRAPLSYSCSSYSTFQMVTLWMLKPFTWI